MAETDSDPLRQRWPEFKKLRSDASAKRISIGIDSGFARKWGLLAHDCASSRVVLSLWFIIAVMFFLTSSCVYVIFNYSAILIGVFLLGGALLGFRLMTHLAVGFARIAALDDEKLFRAWFRKRKLSILVRKTRDIIYQP
jgi:hypothetical protein